MSYLALSASFEYLCYGSTAIRNILILLVLGSSVRVSSESDVYRRQIVRIKSESDVYRREIVRIKSESDVYRREIVRRVRI